MAEVIQVDQVVDAKEGDLRVWWVRNVPGSADFHLVESLKEAVVIINALTQSDLKNPYVESNAGGLEVYEDGEWCEWYDEEGDDIDAWEEKQIPD